MSSSSNKTNVPEAKSATSKSFKRIASGTFYI